MEVLLIILGLLILAFWIFINALVFFKIQSRYATEKNTYFFKCWDRFWEDCQKCFSSPEGLPVLLLFLVVIAFFSKCRFNILSAWQNKGTL